MKPHFRPEQFTEWMIGVRTPESEEHLRECAECAAELDKIQAPIGMFRSAMREWSSLPGPVIEMPAKRPGVLWLRLAASAAVLVALIAIGVDGANRRAAGIEREDDALLEKVSAEVSRQVPAPMQPLYSLMAEETK